MVLWKSLSCRVWIVKSYTYLFPINSHVRFYFFVYANSPILLCSICRYAPEGLCGTLPVKYTVHSFDTLERKVSNLRQKLSPTTINVGSSMFPNTYHRLSTGLSTWKTPGYNYDLFDSSSHNNRFRWLQTRTSDQTQMANIQETHNLCSNAPTSSLTSMKSDQKQILRGADDLSSDKTFRNPRHVVQ